MKAFGYVTAKDVGHAAALLGEHGAKAKILAGGTDLLVELKHAVHNPQAIVDVSRLRELKDIAVKDDGLHIGALATHGDIMASPIIRDMFPALVDAAQASYQLASDRYAKGVDTFLNALVAQRTLYSAQQTLASTQLTALTNRVTLYKVLGGGLGTPGAS